MEEGSGGGVDCSVCGLVGVNEQEGPKEEECEVDD
jgi:hypothetical protein